MDMTNESIIRDYHRPCCHEAYRRQAEKIHGAYSESAGGTPCRT
jgi:hypothetical protein